MKARFPAGVLTVVALGGAAGTLFRAGVAQWVPPSAHGFPWDTLAVNLAGSAVLGFVVVAALERTAPSRYFRPLVGTGFCGGLTTFSSFAVELDLLVKAGHVAVASGYLVASTLGGLAAARSAMVLTRAAWNMEGH